MRRTLLAVGVVTLISILFAPHKHNWYWGHKHYDWADHDRFPAFVVDNGYYYGDNPVQWDAFAAQSVFAAVVAALLVNIRWRRTPKIESRHKSAAD